jgi:transposase-like protein
MSKKISKERVEIKNAIEVNQEQIQGHLNELVRQSVEETLNGLLDAEADRLCQAKRYERVADRADTRAGHYERGLQTQAGEAALAGLRLAPDVLDPRWGTAEPAERITGRIRLPRGGRCRSGLHPRAG